MLRRVVQTNSIYRRPATCHGVIPELTPGRYFHAMATMDYTLIVCGGLLGKNNELTLNAKNGINSISRILKPNVMISSCSVFTRLLSKLVSAHDTVTCADTSLEKNTEKTLQEEILTFGLTSVNCNCFTICNCFADQNNSYC